MMDKIKKKLQRERRLIENKDGKLEGIGIKEFP